MSREVHPNDSFLSCLLKFIPSEIVMVHISIEGVLRGTYASNPKRPEDVFWILSGVLLVLTLI